MRIESYDKGSDLFLAKPVDCQELEAAIKSLVARQTTASQHDSSVHNELDSWYLERHSKKLISPGDKVIQLTGKEYLLLELQAVTPGEAVNREHILDQLYSRNNEYTNRSLDTLVSRARNKIIKLSGLSSLIFCEYGVGYSFSAPLSFR